MTTDTDWPDDTQEEQWANNPVFVSGSLAFPTHDTVITCPPGKWGFVPKYTRKERFMRWYRGLWMRLNPGYMRRNKNEN